MPVSQCVCLFHRALLASQWCNGLPVSQRHACFTVMQCVVPVSLCVACLTVCCLPHSDYIYVEQKRMQSLRILFVCTPYVVTCMKRHTSWMVHRTSFFVHVTHTIMFLYCSSTTVATPKHPQNTHKTHTKHPQNTHKNTNKIICAAVSTCRNALPLRFFFSNHTLLS